jgi:hypothetical protein
VSSSLVFMFARPGGIVRLLNMIVGLGRWAAAKTAVAALLRMVGQPEHDVAIESMLAFKRALETC